MAIPGTVGAPVQQNQYGFWVDAQGDVTPADPAGNPQVTPGEAQNPSSKILYDSDKDLYYNVVNGQKQYLSPSAYQGQSQGTGHGMTNPGGSYLKTGGTWNPVDGKFEQSTNWSNILSTGIAGVLGGAAIGAAAGGGGADAAADATVPSAEGEAAGDAGATTVAGGGVPAGAGDSSILAGSEPATAIPSGSAASLPSDAGAMASATPSALSTILKGAGPLATVLGGAAQNAQKNNISQGQLQLGEDQLQQNANAQATNLPAARLKDSIKASLASNFQPSTVSWGGPGSGLKGQVPTYSGGIVNGLSNLNPATKQLSQQVMEDELLNQMKGGASGGNQDNTVTPVGQPSALDNILGGSAGALSVLSTLAKAGIFS